MRKKILIAEHSDTTRGVAENVLRQHGYEVISVANGEKALEVLELTKPNLIMIDSTMTFKGKKLLLERIQQDPLTSSIPFIIIADENDKSLSFPEEVVLTRPIDPKELILKVSVLGGAARPQETGTPGLLNETDLEDDLLDAALGLDRIDVTDSEILSNSAINKKKGSKGVEKMIGMELDQQDDEDSQGNKIESHRIGDEDTDTGHLKRAPKDPTKTGKLEILSDHEQFGLGNEEILERAGEFGDHDYEWFIKEMKKDNTGQGKTKPAGGETKSPKSSTNPAPAAAPSKKKSDSGKVKSDGGVERFIEDFKKEVEKFTDSAPAKAPKPAAPKAPAPAVSAPSAGADNITIDQVEVFTRQFVDALAEKVAEKIATKIDAQKLLSLIKNEIVSKNQKQ
ncbi:MAG TPA: response regulator [candidate division Zixibacteria bacterium]|nr:response regulator [candidate division Zixibacteria bacterium]